MGTTHLNGPRGHLSGPEHDSCCAAIADDPVPYAVTAESRLTLLAARLAGLGPDTAYLAFTMAADRFAQTAGTGRIPDLVDVLEAATKDVAPL
jgi:hypothetical protein